MEKNEELNENFDLNSLRNEAKQLTSSNVEPSNDGSIVITDNKNPDEIPEYNGPGASISKEEFDKLQAVQSAKGISVGPMAKPESLDGVKEYMKDMDERIAVAKAEAEKIKSDPRFNSLQTVQVIIDKSGLGKVEFTEEEKAKMEKASKIVLVEQSEEAFKNIKVKKKLVGSSIKTVAEKIFDKSLSEFVNVASGYCGKMGNISSSEAITLLDSEGKATSESVLEKWSVLYKKIKSTSIGKFDSFDHFLKETALSDYPIMVYAAICASYPDKDKLLLTCGNEKCKQEFEYEYQTSKLIRTDLISSELADKVYDIVSHQTFIETAKEIHEKSPVKTINRLSITDDNSILFDLYIPSAYEGIERMYKGLDPKWSDDRKYFREWNVLHFIKCAYLLDDDGEYIAIEEPNAIIEDILLNLTEYQIKRLIALTEKLTNNLSFEFGLKTVECPRCHHKLTDYNIPIDVLLFLRVRRLMDTEIG